MINFKEIQESLIVHFKSLYNAVRGKTGKELDEALISQVESEEQKKLIQEKCQDIDDEHDMIEEMVKSDKMPGEFLEQDIRDAVKEENPNATEEEVNQSLEQARDVMEKDIAVEAKELIEDSSSNDNEQTES
ncbi:MAG: hypothetical protein IJ748_02345 [Bacteroidales bacterium]|nr:hypothetical protein [Bacteroidales bacterium]